MEQTTKSKSVSRIVLTVIAVILFLGGVGIIYFTMFHQEKATELYGEVKVYAADVIRENGGTPPGQETYNGLPVIRLEGEGGQTELDYCTGAFVHMLTYQDKNNLPPVWSAHNGCGGDILLSWQPGTRFMIGDQEYEVVDVRTAPQVGGTTDNIAGIGGELVLQSCSYDGRTMFFMGANKVKTEAQIQAEKEAQNKLQENQVEDNASEELGEVGME